MLFISRHTLSDHMKAIFASCPWADAITRHTAAVQAARHLVDRLGQASALNDLGDVRQATGDYPAAVLALEQALGIYRDMCSRWPRYDDADPPPGS
jgi:hypothetical protein